MLGVSIRVLVVTILLVLGVRCSGESPPGKDLEVGFEETLRLGENRAEAPDHALFSIVSEVAVDQNGNMYVVNGNVSAVRVYDEQGTFLRSIGERGAGPGEFQEISALHIDRHERLLVADSNQGLVTAFSLEGKLLATYQFSEIRKITQIADLSRGKYVVVGPGDNHLVHVVDTSFTEVKARLVPRESVETIDHKLERIVVDFSPGSVSVLGDSTIAYAPSLYTGTLYEYTQLSNGAWGQSHSYEGYGRHVKPITITPIDEADRVDLPIRLQSGQYAGHYHSVSTGAYRIEDEMVHFSAQENGNVIDLLMERFQIGGGLIESAMVDTMSSLSLLVREVDDRGNIYLSDRRGIPQLVRLEMESGRD